MVRIRSEERVYTWGSSQTVRHPTAVRAPPRKRFLDSSPETIARIKQALEEQSRDILGNDTIPIKAALGPDKTEKSPPGESEGPKATETGLNAIW